MGVSKRLAVMATVLTGGMLASPVMAHHSFAMFDNKKEVTLDGTVKEFQWTNPHSWVQLIAKDPATGKDVEWSIEAGSPNGLARQGWSRHSAKPGDKASIVIHPLKDGSAGGSLVSLTVNGAKVGRERIGS